MGKTASSKTVIVATVAIVSILAVALVPVISAAGTVVIEGHECKVITDCNTKAYTDSSIGSTGYIYIDCASVKNRAFARCNGLIGVYCSGSVRTVGDSSFISCKNLKVFSGESVTSIGDSAFSSCVSLCDLRLSSKLTSIGDETFMSCDSLTGPVLSGTQVKTVPTFSFGYCRKLMIEDFTYVTSLSLDAHRNCNVRYQIVRHDSKPFNMLDGPTRIVMMESGSYSYAKLEGDLLMFCTEGMTPIRFFDPVTHEIVRKDTTVYGFDTISLPTSEIVGSNRACEVRYMVPGGTDLMFLNGTGITVNHSAPASSQGTFIGWSTISDADSAEYANGASVTLSSDLILYPVYESPKASVTLEWFSKAHEVFSVKIGDGFRIPDEPDVRDGYVFAGWSLTNGGSMDYLPGESFIVDADVHLHPVWLKSGGSLIVHYTDVDDVQRIDSDDTYTTQIDTNPGMAFAGWSTSPDGETRFADRQSIPVGTRTELYPVWTDRMCPVTFHPPDGDMTMMVENGHEVTMPSAAEMPGVEGWSMTPHGDTVLYPGERSIVEYPMELYPVLKETQGIRVTVHLPSGTETHIIPEGGSFTTPSYWDGQRAVGGWSTSFNGMRNYGAGEGFVPYRDMDLYPLW